MIGGRLEAAAIPRAAALVAAAALALSGCGTGTSAEAGSDRIAPEALAAQLEEGAAPLVLDVRTPGEYADGHIPGAVNVHYTESEAWLAADETDPDSEVVVYCEAARKSPRSPGLAVGDLLTAS